MSGDLAGLPDGEVVGSLVYWLLVWLRHTEYAYYFMGLRHTECAYYFEQFAGFPHIVGNSRDSEIAPTSRIMNIPYLNQCEGFCHACGPTAIYGISGSGDKSGGIAGEEQCYLCYVVGLTDAAHWGDCACKLTTFGVFL